MSSPSAPGPPPSEQLVQTERRLGGLAVQHAVRLARRHYVVSSLWVLGLLVAALFRGFAVDEASQQRFELAMQEAALIEDGPLARAERSFEKADAAYQQARGWFWSCDERCQLLRTRREAAQSELSQRLQERDAALQLARSHVGVWSVYGVAELRRRFWGSVNDGNSFALRWTMFDALFMSLGGGGGRSEEAGSQLVVFCFKLLMRFLVNLTLGMASAAVYFLFAVYSVLRQFGAGGVSALLFWSVGAVAGLASIALYLAVVFGVAGGSVYYVARQAILASLQDGGPDGRHGGQGGRARLDQRAAWQYQQHAQGRGHPSYRPAGDSGGRPHWD